MKLAVAEKHMEGASRAVDDGEQQQRNWAVRRGGQIIGSMAENEGRLNARTHLSWGAGNSFGHRLAKRAALRIGYNP
ncbi:MAG: hypothetical protein KGO02_14965 [Alphaproteobacteria bacterium]|nr:hypothetical protein [Alphaproteobacteria bacterium]